METVTVKSRAGDLRVVKIAHHRNGISGVGFYVVLFYWDDRHMIATVFAEKGYVSVLDRADVVSGEIAFDAGDFKGGDFENGLRKAISKSRLVGLKARDKWQI